MTTVQVFGLQRSGTNYLHEVIALNLDVNVVRDLAGWKHGYPNQRSFPDTKAPPQARPIRVQLDHLDVTPVVIRKDLDHWLASIQRLPRDIEKTRGFSWDDPARTWHEFYEAWSFALVVRYEAFIADFRGGLDALARTLDVAVVSYEEPEMVRDSADWSPEHRARYV